MYKLIFLVLIVAVIFFIIINAEKFFNGASEIKTSDYKRKKFLFDSAQELNLFNILTELYGQNYVIFAQVNYSHLLEPKKNNYKEKSSARSRIDRKSADFVICEKGTIAPKLIIELDGPRHEYSSKTISRDNFINSITNVADLPLVHIKVQDLNKENVKRILDEALAQ